MLRISNKSLVLVLLMAMALSVEKALAEPEVVARVIVASGNVTARSDDTARSLERRSRVYEGEAVLTGEASQAQLRFSDGAVLSLDPGTELLIRAYQHVPGEAEQSQALLEMVTGGLRTLTGAMADEFPEGYEVATPVAGIGIRGTDFQAVMGEEGLAVGVWEDSIHVTNEAGTVDIGPELAYQFAVVAGAQMPPQPQLQRPTELGISGVLDDGMGEKQRDNGDSSVGDSMDVAYRPTDQEEDSVQQSFSEENQTSDFQQPDADPEEESEPTELTVPDWFASFEERTRSGAHFRVSNGGISGSGSRVSNPQTAEGMTIPVGSRNLTEQDVGYLVPPEALAAANPVNDFPAVWGRWNDAEELYFFFNSPDDDGNFDPEEPEDVRLGSPEELGFLGGGWVAATEPALSLADVAAIRPETLVTFGSTDDFETGPVKILDSGFSAGTLDETQSFMEFSLNPASGELGPGQMVFVVEGAEFDEIWEWEGDSGAIFESSEDTTFPDMTVVFGSEHWAVSRTDESLNPDFVQGQVGGFVVESGEAMLGDNQQLGLLGTGSFTAREGDMEGEILSEGGFLLVLPES